MRKCLLIITLIAFAEITISAQGIQLSPSVIASAGSYNESGNIKLSWTLGEIAVTTLQQGELILSQGFQQSYQNNVGFNLEPIKWQILAYPNPVGDLLKIQFDLQNSTDFIIEIQDIAGKLLSLKEYKHILPGDVISIKMDSYTYGVYFFRISTLKREQVRVIPVRKL